MKNEQCLVYVTDGIYATATIASIQSAKEVGCWTGPVLLIESALSPCLKEHREILAAQGAEILTLPMPPEFVAGIDAELRPSFLKALLFTHPRFREFDVCHYVDSDVLFLRSIPETMGTIEFPEGCYLGCRENPGKGSLLNHEIDFKGWEYVGKTLGLPDRDDPPSTCLVSIDMEALPPPAELFERIRRILCDTHDWLKHSDQSLFALVFYHEYFIHPFTTVMSHVGDPNTLPGNTIAIHTCAFKLFTRPDTPNHPDYLEYMARARECVQREEPSSRSA